MHSLLWLKNQVGDEAPSFSVEDDQDETHETNEQDKIKKDDLRIKKVEKFADFMMSTSPDDMTCEKHKSDKCKQDTILLCTECQFLKEKVEKYQSHNHTFTCAKKMKTMTVKETEGYGRLDGKVKGPALQNIPVCRFKFPKFPLDETKLIRGMSKDTDEKIVKARKDDLNKIMKFLVRQT